MIPNPLFVSVAEIRPDLLERLAIENIGVELSYFAYPWNLQDKSKLAKDIAWHKQMFQDFPLAKTMHGAFYDLNFVARDEMLLDVAHFRVQQSIDIAKELEMKDIVFHTNYVHSTHSKHKQYWIEKQIEFWEKYAADLAANEISIYLENTREEDFSYIHAIIENIQSPNIQICYDTGHSHCFTDSKIPPIEWAKGYAKSLKYIHLHSNHGKTDEHIAYTKGNVDFTGFFSHITQMQDLPKVIIEVKSAADFEQSLFDLRNTPYI